MWVQAEIVSLPNFDKTTFCKNPPSKPSQFRQNRPPPPPRPHAPRTSFRRGAARERRREGSCTRCHRWPKCGNELASEFPTIRARAATWGTHKRPPRPGAAHSRPDRRPARYSDSAVTALEMLSVEEPQPISRTYQYRKVMKPMLERKRRARINRCLDELKELMVTALQSEGENVSKLEKADILELTVRHLHRLRRQRRLAASPVVEADRFRAGYTHCANEVSRCLAAIPHVDVRLGTRLMTHLGHRLNEMDAGASPPPSPAPPDYALPPTPASSAASPAPHDCTALLAAPREELWRPW